MMNQKLLGVAAVLTVLLAGCGGGSGGTSAGTMSNKITIANTALRAGQSVDISAEALMRADTPGSMSWTATPLFTPGANDTPVTLGDSACAGATFSAPPFPTSSGMGVCRTVLSVPAGMKDGQWRITSTATSASGAISDSVTVSVVGLPASGFQLVESSLPVAGSVGQVLSLNLPFTVNAGGAVSNVKYQWTAAATNPSASLIAGSRNSTASVVPTVAGEYRFNVSATATVNGSTETTTGAVIAVVSAPSVADQISAGAPQVVAPGAVVSLSGSILNKDPALAYATTWSQLTGAAGGPAPLTVLNANASTASFVAPTTSGTYGFEYKVVKTQSNGSQMVTTTQTAVVVSPVSSGVFTAVAGDVQSVAIGSVAILDGSVDAQAAAAGVTYSYQWTQVGSTPAVVTLSNATAAKASFIPSVPGAYTFELAVTATSATGTTRVTGLTQVVTASTASIALSADAGVSQTAAPGDVVSLVGKQTTQGSAVGVTYAYAWTQTGTAPAVTISGTDSSTASFVAATPGTYEFMLTVTATLSDGSVRVATSSTQVVISGGVAGNAFSVSAGNAQTVSATIPALLPGSVTMQGTFTGATFTYAWTQVGASPAPVLLTNATSLASSIVPTVTGVYTLQLTVTATQGGVSTVQTAQTQVLVVP